VNLELSFKEQERIDVAVGLYRTKDVTFGSYLHEWSASKGKDKKPPEQVNYWNANLSNEIEVETDLYLQHLLVENKDNNNFTLPCLNYGSNGFAKHGVTVLFGGDHGDNHCPISCKLNLSPPEERKRRQELGYQFPVVCFASVACSKDAYDLMDATVMPQVKDQLFILRWSSLVTVYHKLRMRECFRSCMVPASINKFIIGFITKTDDYGNKFVSTTFAHGKAQQLTFGYIDLLDSMFMDVHQHDLAAQITIGCFNELFLGDLAFLAMLIGMNNSSGSHCLMCLRTRSEFNCNHNQCTKRTRETLEHALEQYILKHSDGKKGPPERKGLQTSTELTAKGCGRSIPRGLLFPSCTAPWD
jgi:hypothetical protein